MSIIGTDQLIIILTLISITLFILGIPIFLVFGVWVLGFHVIVPAFPMSNVAISHYSELQTFGFTAIPLFIIVGDLINEAKISSNLIRFARSLIGWLPGVTANTAIVTSAIFSAITGSNAATTASIGKAMYPNMVEEGYNRPFAAGTIAAGGTLGAIIPPSILLIIYGVTFNVSVSKLFVAGIIPGIMMLCVLIGINVYTCHQRGYGETTESSTGALEIMRAAWNAKVGLGTIFILLGGIFLGFFTPSESAAVATIYIGLMGYLTGGLNNVAQYVRAGKTAAVLIGVLFPVVIMSILIQQNLSFLNIQKVISELIIGLGNDWFIMLAMISVMLVTGATLASVPNLVLTAPLLAGAASSIGLSPVSWGIIFMISDTIGFITPPYGLNLYIISGITDIDYIKIARKVAAYLIGLILVWVFFFIFPESNILI
jgi:C4-dicarboxylate transporter DctM subunit